jgi:drug/metabolite transporter (DMT)-like permease
VRLNKGKLWVSANSPPMLSRIRHAPGLRSRSNVEVGVYGAIAANLVLAVALTVSTPHSLRNPSRQLLEAFAGVGGAVFLAYTVAITGLARGFPRGSESETALGFMTGLGVCGIFGVGLVLLLLDARTPFSWLDHLALYWAACSVTLLAGLVAGSPLIAYEDPRAKHLNLDE